VFNCGTFARQRNSHATVLAHGTERHVRLTTDRVYPHSQSLLEVLTYASLVPQALTRLWRLLAGQATIIPLRLGEIAHGRASPSTTITSFRSCPESVPSHWLRTWSEHRIASLKLSDIGLSQQKMEPFVTWMGPLDLVSQITNRSVTQVKFQLHGTGRLAGTIASITRRFLYDTAVGSGYYSCIYKQVNVLRMVRISRPLICLFNAV